jgi:UDP-N-acetylmuramyl pentapeptide phosphotransferase/UDP-N-acetylglucosamine-1-phosphate transferase
MENWMIGALVMVVAMVTSLMVFPWALKFAREHGIVDNPNARKLQRVPVPVFGGVVVYSGILVGGLVLSAFMWDTVMVNGLIGMGILLLLGLWDDQKDISALLRFLIEIALVSAFIALTGVYIDDLHGLWGINHIDDWVAIPLSVFVGASIINAVNLIDGVDGYSSGYGMMACMCFGLCYWTVWSPTMTCLTMIVIGALFPFFMHNVFGQRSRMFIGDGGTLMLGMFLTVCAFYALSSTQPCNKLDEKGLCLLAYALAVLCIPLYDTLRVFTMRILRGKSPFKPDKTHLHHLFIDMGFSHLGAALSILIANLSVVLAWLVSWKLGANADVQMYVVVVFGFLVTFAFYKFMKVQQNGGPVDEDGYPQGTWLWHRMCALGHYSHKEKKRTWKVLRRIVDGPLMGGIGSKD